MSKLIFCLMGPTASGKTNLACELLTHFPFEIISVDSAMIYREMNIGTAKPTPLELQKAPHHLIDIIDPIAAYSAAQFCTDALLLCEQIRSRNKIPLLVGGTMMYFNALQKGLSSLPDADDALRKTLEEQAKAHGLSYLHQQLEQVDKESALKIHAHDAQRIQRALEVYYSTGIPLSVLQQTPKQTADNLFINLVLFPEQRQWLHERIAQRFDAMLALGLIDEVQQLMSKWPLEPSMPALRCVGYRQIYEYLLGETPLHLLRDKGLAATRQLAKRQLTWLRHWQDALYYDPQPVGFHKDVVAKIQKLLDNQVL